MTSKELAAMKLHLDFEATRRMSSCTMCRWTSANSAGECRAASCVDGLAQIALHDLETQRAASCVDAWAKAE